MKQICKVKIAVEDADLFHNADFFFFLQGLYVFAVYFVMHNQLCWPTKASYTVEMSGHDGPDPSYQGGGPTTVGGDISKSTQNLISAMEEVNTRNTPNHIHTQLHRKNLERLVSLLDTRLSFCNICNNGTARKAQFTRELN